MAHYFRSLLLIALIIALPVPVGVQAALPLRLANPPAPAAPTALDAFAWYDGPIQYSTITNCASIIQGFPYQENGAGTYVGFLADPDAGRPAPNTTYYVHVVIAGLGNACSGMRAYLDLALPASTSLAIDSGNHVYCLYDGVQISPASDCPQSLPPSTYNPGAYAIWSTDGAHANTWPIPQGHTLEFQIPVKSSVALSNSQLQANVWMLDGNSSPWLRPQQGVYVFSSQPTIIYPSPSTTLVTATTAHSQAYLYTFGATGTGYFDLGTTTSYGLIHEAVAITTPGTAWLVYDDWGPPALTPDTLYHWRFTFTTGSQTYYGADQTFRTIPDGRVTVGSGSAAGCNQAALTTALSTAKEVIFDCGTLPITITLSSAHSIASNLTINGGNKVTLDGQGATNHFNVLNFWHLTLENISLVNGKNTSACGGSIHVFPFAVLTLNGVRFINNATDSTGGAFCVDTNGAALVQNALFKGNSAFAFGGAIRTYGLTDLTNAIFTANSAGTNGGGIDNTNDLYIVNSTFNGNMAGVRGGAINNYLGHMTVTGSSFSSNSSDGYGGGIANDAGTATLQNNQFTGNTAKAVGGGVRNNGDMTASGNTFVNNSANDSGGAFENVGNLTSINNTLSANSAMVNGGGVFWNGGQITLLNTTLNGNTAGTQGGNIFVGGVGVYNADINLKNTIVGSGSPNNCSGTLLSNGNNLENTNTCGLTAVGDQRDVNPKLGPLQNNGGATWTHALLFGSPAIDAGTNSGCPATDQRGVARPIDGNRDGSSVCDIGAVEAPPPWQVFLPLARK
jgi:predicted outer membrane repeat protein